MVSKEKAIRDIIDAHPEDIIVVCNAMCRDVYEIADRDNILYLSHGMGQALSVAVGLATAIDDREIVVIDGDGNALMGMSSWPLAIEHKNITHCVLDNEIYETTGGQPVPDAGEWGFRFLPIMTGKISRPSGMGPRLMETDGGYLDPAKTLPRFIRWLNTASK